MNDLTAVLDVKFMNCKDFLTEYLGEKEQGWKINLLNCPLLVYCNEGRVVSIEFDGERDSEVYLKNESGWEYEMSWAVPDLTVISPKKNILIDFTQLPDKVSFLPSDEEVSRLFLGGQIKQSFQGKPMEIILSKKYNIGYFILKIKEGKNVKSIGEVHFFFDEYKKPIIKIKLDYEITLVQLTEVNKYLQSYNFKEVILEDFKD